jgi:hypothetical protein
LPLFLLPAGSFLPGQITAWEAVFPDFRIPPADTALFLTESGPGQSRQDRKLFDLSDREQLFPPKNSSIKLWFFQIQVLKDAGILKPFRHLVHWMIIKN